MNSIKPFVHVVRLRSFYSCIEPVDWVKQIFSVVDWKNKMFEERRVYHNHHETDFKHNLCFNILFLRNCELWQSFEACRSLSIRTYLKSTVQLILMNCFSPFACLKSYFVFKIATRNLWFSCFSYNCTVPQIRVELTLWSKKYLPVQWHSQKFA